MAELDWRSIFCRYAGHVDDTEGNDFITSYLARDPAESPHDDDGSDLFTADELLAMRQTLGVRRQFRQAVAGFVNVATIDGRIIHKLYTQLGSVQLRTAPRRTVGMDGVTVWRAEVVDGVILVDGAIDCGRSGYLSLGLDNVKLSNLAALEDDLKGDPLPDLLIGMSGFLSYVTLTDRPCWPGLTHLEGFPSDV